MEQIDKIFETQFEIKIVIFEEKKQLTKRTEKVLSDISGTVRYFRDCPRFPGLSETPGTVRDLPVIRN